MSDQSHRNGHRLKDVDGIPEDHVALVESQTIERYVLGRLPREEAERFEQHYVDCPTCLDLLETTEAMVESFRYDALRNAFRDTPRDALRDGLRETPQAAQQDTSRDRGQPLPVSTLESPRVARAGNNRWMPARAIAAGLLLALGLWTGWRNLELSHKLSTLQEHVTSLSTPQANPMHVVLSPLRGSVANPPPSGARRLRLPTAPSLVILTLELGLSPNSPCKLTIENATRQLWSSPELRADPEGNVSISFPSSFFEPGEIFLRAEDPNGKPLARLDLTLTSAQ